MVARGLYIVYSSWIIVFIIFIIDRIHVNKIGVSGLLKMH